MGSKSGLNLLTFLIFTHLFILTVFSKWKRMPLGKIMLGFTFRNVKLGRFILATIKILRVSQQLYCQIPFLFQ